jgi:hypothetical protein
LETDNFLSKDNTTRKLAETKAYLEKRVSELSEETKKLNSFLAIIDEILAEKSFKKMEIPKSQIESITHSTKVEEKEFPKEITPLMVEGKKIGEIFLEGNNLTVIPAENMKYDVSSPPMRAFLISKVLEPMKVKDQEQVRAGKISKGEQLTYEIDLEKGNLKVLVIHNFGDQKRLLDLKNAIRWTFRRIYEKNIER